MFQRQIENGFARETPLHHDGIRPLFVHGGKRRGELLLAADHDCLDCNAQGAAALLDLFNERPGEWIGRDWPRRPRAAWTAAPRGRVRGFLLPSSAAAPDNPVMLPPGRARLEMRPVPSGSPAGAMTIGISDVACLAAMTAGVCDATMMSTLRRTSSSANARRRSGLPSAERSSNCNVLPLACSHARAGLSGTRSRTVRDLP